MATERIAIRESVIPDINVKLLDLCLNDDENGTLIKIDFWAEEQESSNIDLEKLLSYKTVPITMRKFMLCHQSVAS